MRLQVVREQERERAATAVTIAAYLEALRAELAGADPALVQDALAGAEDYLRSEQAEQAAHGHELPEAELVRRTLERYGTPEEVAQAYRDSERHRLAPGPFPAPLATPTWQRRIFGVFTDPRAYGAFFFMFLSLATGIVYFTWAITGLLLSIGLAPLVVGLPFALLYLGSLRAFAVLEGRMVEGLLGERMPRRAAAPAAGGIWQRIKGWVSDPRTWSTLAYFVMMLPLGIFYFTLFTVLLSLTLGLAVAPFAQLFATWNETLHLLPVDLAPTGSSFVMFHFGRWHLELTPIMWPVIWLAAAFDLLVALHVARLIGRLHARFAKAMLVRP
jgi:hypothetical protein